MKRILVTGAAGFVGRHVMSALSVEVKPSEQIVGIGRGSFGCLPDGVGYQEVDLLDKVALSTFIDDYKPTVVLHLAAMASAQQLHKNSNEIWHSNIVALINLAEAILRFCAGATFFFVSSGEVYGRAFLTNAPLSEDVTPVPFGAYALSKKIGEEILRDVLPQGNVRLVILRPFNHIGPGQDGRFVVPSFANQIARIEANLSPPILEVGNLESKRDFLSVCNVVRAYVALIKNFDTIEDGEVFNISSGNARSIGSVLSNLRKHATRAFDVRVAENRVRPAEIPVAAGDASRLNAAIGWTPIDDWDNALVSVLEYARKNTR